MANAIGVGLLVLVALSFAVLAHDQEVRETQSSGQINSNTDYKHIWPVLRFSWKILVGTLIAFIGAAFGSVGGIGGGGFFVPMLTLIIGFDQKSATAISTCMITGAATATVFYNLWQRHPTLELPIIDYDLALLFQPMLMVGISIGVSLNIVLSEWMITMLLIVALLGTTTKSFLKGIEAWKKETAAKKNSGDASGNLQLNGDGTGLPANGVTEVKEAKRVSILHNASWNQFGIVVVVWFAILAVQISMQYVNKCSVAYWLLEVAQIPVVVAASSYEAVKLYKGQRRIASAGEAGTIKRVHKLLYYCACGIVGGIVGGVLGFGGGFIMGPLFLGIGLPPQVSSATSTFIMTFSSSMSVVEFYLLKRFPIPYALYYTVVATLSAIIGQHIAGKVIKALGRASLIIFVLAFTMLVSALSLGGVGLVHMVKQIERKEYMGFESMCSNKS